MIPREHLELHPPEDEPRLRPHPIATGPVAGDWPLRTLALTVLVLAAFTAGLVVGVSIASAAPRPALDRVDATSRSGPDLGRTGASQAASRSSEESGQPMQALARPVSSRGASSVSRWAGGAPLSGIASWYPAVGLIAAAGPGLRHGHWRGSHLVVSANGRAVTVELADWCLCPHGRLIDLSDDAFARLAPLSRGLVHVTITAAGPAPTLPPTDSGGKP